jgi:hypothetical protein
VLLDFESHVGCSPASGGVWHPSFFLVGVVDLYDFARRSLTHEAFPFGIFGNRDYPLELRVFVARGCFPLLFRLSNLQSTEQPGTILLTAAVDLMHPVARPQTD